MRESVLAEKALIFAVDILKLVRSLQERKEYIISRQLGKSGTSIGANIREAQFAVSSGDFIAKLHIALKEANETDYWLELLLRTNELDRESYERLSSQCQQLRAMLIASIKTAKENQKA